MKFDIYNETLSIRQLQRWVGKDAWVYCWLTSWAAPHDYYVNIVNLSVDATGKCIIEGYFMEAFYLDLLLEDDTALSGDCYIIIKALMRTPDNLSKVAFDDLDFPVPVEVLNTDDILSGLRNAGYDV